MILVDGDEIIIKSDKQILKEAMANKAIEKIVEQYRKHCGWEYAPGNEDTDIAYETVNFIVGKAISLGYIQPKVSEDPE